jgi:hypothetical protein
MNIDKNHNLISSGHYKFEIPSHRLHQNTIFIINKTYNKHHKQTNKQIQKTKIIEIQLYFYDY